MKKQRNVEVELSPTLEGVLEQLMDRDFAGKLRSVYLAAASAIEQLSTLNLVRYERKTLPEDGPADLLLWEEMAPAVRDTVLAINGLLAVIRMEFPLRAPDGEAKGRDREAPASMDARLADEVDAVFQRTAEDLTREIAGIRDRVLRPEVVSERWALLSELQNVREEFRRQVGNLVYLTAAAFAEVDRADVVPGHQAHMDAAAELRSTTAELLRSLEGKLQKVTDGAPAAAVTRQIEGDLDFFIRMPAFLSLRALEKRAVAQFREKLSQVATNPDLSTEDFRSQFSAFLELLRSFGDAASREVLTAHDREVWTACGGLLEQAQLHLALGSMGARRALAQAIKAASALYGREPVFDLYLRKLRSRQVNSLPEGELALELATFRDHLAQLPFH